MNIQEVSIQIKKSTLESYKKFNQLKLQDAETLRREFLSKLTPSRRFKHYNLYNFWSRSEGLWVSKLVKVTVKFLDEQELLVVSKIHALDNTEFGVRVSWEYTKKEESGHMSWCVDSHHLGLVFTDKSLLSDTPPQILNYQMINENKLVITAGKYEETFLIHDDTRRLRELRYDGKLVRRLWENKFLP